MKFFLSLYIVSLIFLFSCENSKIEHLNFDKEIYSPEYSTNFKIYGNEESENIMLTVYNPWQGANNISQEFIITKDNNGLDSFDGQVLKNEAKRIVCMSSTHIAMLEALNAFDRIVGVSGKQYVSNPKILSDNRSIPDVGYEGNIDYEALIATNPDLVLLFSINGISSMEPKLKELGIPFFYIGDYIEEEPLGKTEWIIPLGELIGEREKAIHKFDEIKKRYNILKDSVGKLELYRPKVMVNAPFMDAWFMPSTQSYIARMIADAQGEYIYKKNTGTISQPIDMEEALKLVSETDYWINIGTLKSMQEFEATFPKFINTKCVKEDKLFNNNLKTSPGGGNDCYESGVINPELVLRDMIKILHPELIKEDFTYYHRLN